MRGPAWIPLLAAGCLAWGLGCSPAQRPNVVLLVVDTLRADRLPFDGGDPATAPFLAELAERSLVFRDTRTVSSWTAPAMASMFTSTHPDRHGVDTGFRAYMMGHGGPRTGMNRLPDALETLPELMSKNGYATFGISSNPNVSEAMGFDRGFDRFETVLYRARAGHGNAAELVDRALAWLPKLRAARRFFLYVHFMDTHDPYVWHEGAEAGRVAPLESMAAYDGEIRYVDAQIERLYQALGLRDAVVIFAADHGQEFGEHGEHGHGFKLYSELTRVPLLVQLPGPDAVSGAVEGPASTLDILPTLRALIGAPPSEQDVGMALVANGRPADLPERDRFGMRTARSRGATFEKLSIVRGPLELIVSEPRERLELYNLAHDPGERRNLASRRPKLARELQAALEARRQATISLRSEAPVRGPTAEETEALRELGYVESEPE